MISTTSHEKRRITALIHSMGARRVLEIGAFRGETTRVMADAVRERAGRVVVIDPMRWSSEVFRNGIARHLPAPLARLVTRLEQWSEIASYEPAFWSTVGGKERSDVLLYRALSNDRALIAREDPELHEFDVVFIDGDHRYEGALSDLVNWGRRVRPGGLVLVHDATSRFPGVMRAIREWSTAPDVEITWPDRDSLCVLRVGSASGAVTSASDARQEPPPETLLSDAEATGK